MRWNPLHALKLLLPSWNFFDDFEAVPRLEVRSFSAGEAAAGWRPLLLPPKPRGWSGAFYNPWGNLDLMERSLVERAADEIEELAGPAGVVSRPYVSPEAAAAGPAHVGEPADDFCRSETFALLARLARRHGRPPEGTAQHDPGAGAWQMRIVRTRPGAEPETIWVSPTLGEAGMGGAR